MNEIDYHYFQSLTGPFYDWERQMINIGCSKSDLDIPNLTNELSVEQRKNFALLVHEYIHYLQNFATAWGAPVFTDFSLALMKIGASSASSKNVIELPINKSNLSKDLLNGIELREKVGFRLSKFSQVQYHDDHALTAINLTSPNHNGVVLTNGRVTIELGGKTIREHMAHIGTQLFLGKSDNDIHELNKNYLGFRGYGVEFSNKPEYWILFEFFFEMNLYSNIAGAILYLAQVCLITLNPELALLRFINWHVRHKKRYPKQCDLVNVVVDWLKSNDEKLYLIVGLRESLAQCGRTLEVAKKHLAEHDIFRFTFNITEYAIDNLNKSAGGQTLFMTGDNFADVKYWQKKIHNFGTGLIRHTDGVNIYGTTNHCDKMQDSFYFLMSCSLVIKKIVSNQKSNCPFIEDIPICSAEFKGEENCFKNPFLMVNQHPDNKSCLFANGVLLLGMQNRVFQK